MCEATNFFLCKILPKCQKKKTKRKRKLCHNWMSRALGKGYGMKCGHNGNISRSQWEFWRWNLLGTWWEPHGIHWEHHDPSKIQPLYCFIPLITLECHLFASSLPLPSRKQPSPCISSWNHHLNSPPPYLNKTIKS